MSYNNLLYCKLYDKKLACNKYPKSRNNIICIKIEYEDQKKYLMI